MDCNKRLDSCSVRFTFVALSWCILYVYCICIYCFCIKNCITFYIQCMYINVYIICRTHLFVTRVSDYMAARAHEQKYQGKKREKKMEFIPGVRKQTGVAKFNIHRHTCEQYHIPGPVPNGTLNHCVLPLNPHFCHVMPLWLPGRSLLRSSLQCRLSRCRHRGCIVKADELDTLCSYGLKRHINVVAIVSQQGHKCTWSVSFGIGLSGVIWLEGMQQRHFPSGFAAFKLIIHSGSKLTILTATNAKYPIRISKIYWYWFTH